MSLLEEIKKDQRELRLDYIRKGKNGVVGVSDQHMIASLTTLISEASRPGLDDGKRESTDAEVISVIKKTISGIKERLDIQYDEMLHTEMCYLSAYLPDVLSDDDLEMVINDFIDETLDVNIGKVMRFLKETYPGQYDGKRASELTRNLLQ